MSATPPPLFPHSHDGIWVGGGSRSFEGHWGGHWGGGALGVLQGSLGGHWVGGPLGAGSRVGRTPTYGYQNDQRDVLNIRGVKIFLQKKILYPNNGGSTARWKVVVVVVVVVVTVFFMLCMHMQILHRILCILSINTKGEK